ncbi:MULTISPECIES: sodium-dependent transporter [Halobacterium]|uniref:SNF family transport protein n=4 Tax=Halobacterium salinarum TaxID=2242 RepID=Q9HPQ1_HALSA|nr:MULTISPECIES: sodium-dependent transporter [Halobacterium]AAG19816.1 sodium- and chloride-dependent transporter [Halobacterium salinarum NRC-1]MBB6088821.1 NSS family neurotransmitter:Na+ symporter [Halobacterium salinarum]MCF2166023.1 sodium-dependent transporter [Halobacterium salinarum]MCF2167543.1 sodium-dependent transporter [Halobacterium salinarum]MCF2239340.1 sodium-dependent transporter [Halobacterium salinarum]
MARDVWHSRLGFIMAAVGSAVGLGNLWRFPWMTSENGGAAFLLVYLGVVLCVGVPGLLAEFVIGRRSRRSPVGAFSSLSDSTLWRVFGHLSVVIAVVLLSFYSVVGGWILRYFGASLTGAYFSNPGQYFATVSYGLDAVGFHLLFLAITGLIVVRGIKRGIENATKLMMPAVVVLLIVLAAWASTLDGAGAGLAFYLSPDVELLEADLLGILPAAAGQALFTLSLGSGTMITYASYLDEERSLAADGAAIAVLNTCIGVLAGLVVFPLLFALVGDAGTGGPGALFVGLANAFVAVPYGRAVGAVFFAVVSLAAISSSISMLELPVSFLVDEYGVSRRRATALFVGVFTVTGSATALSPGLFDFVAGTLVDLLMTAGLIGFLLFTGWVVGQNAVTEYELGAGAVASALSTPWLYAVGVVIPVFLIFTLVSGIAAALGVSITAVELWGVTISQPRLFAGLSVVIAVVSFLGLRRPASVA